MDGRRHVVPDESGFASIVVAGGQVTIVMVWILASAHRRGMIGSGIAASRFLDV